MDPEQDEQPASAISSKVDEAINNRILLNSTSQKVVMLPVSTAGTLQNNESDVSESGQNLNIENEKELEEAFNVEPAAQLEFDEDNASSDNSEIEELPHVVRRKIYLKSTRGMKKFSFLTLKSAYDVQMNFGRRNDLLEKESDRESFIVPRSKMISQEKHELVEKQTKSIRKILNGDPDCEHVGFFKCQKCNKCDFKDFPSLKLHYMCCSRRRKCPDWIRGKNVFTHPPSNRSLQKKLTSKPKCSLCKRVYPSLIHLKAHEAMYGKIQCPDRRCGKKFATHCKQNIHMAEKHLSIGCKCLLMCPVCNHRFPSMDLLISHSLCHTFKKYFCPQCEDSFPTLQSVLDHMNSHNCYKCKFCGKYFDDLLVLTYHQRTHSSFLCMYCNLKFASSSHLRNHVKNCKGKHSRNMLNKSQLKKKINVGVFCKERVSETCREIMEPLSKNKGRLNYYTQESVREPLVYIRNWQIFKFEPASEESSSEESSDDAAPSEESQSQGQPTASGGLQPRSSTPPAG